MIAALLERAARRLAGVSATPRLDVELLLAHALGVERARLLALDALAPDAGAAFERLLARRATGEPVAYLLGRREFWTLTLEVGPGVLVPRPETELLVELALAAIAGRPQPSILDLGAGSGAIGFAIAASVASAAVDLVEASPAALAFAERNRRRLGLANARLLAGNWFEPVAGRRYDVIVSNPPYLAAGDPHLEAPELGHEPRAALVAGDSGLEALAAIATACGPYLAPGGALILEHGALQAAAVRDLLHTAGLVQVQSHADLAGLERATQGRRR